MNINDYIDGFAAAQTDYMKELPKREVFPSYRPDAFIRGYNAFWRRHGK